MMYQEKSEDEMATRSMIGKHLASLRDLAGLKQNELAKRLPWSPTILSRIETGEREVSPDELDVILDGIGTSDATILKHRLRQIWRVLPEPALDDDDWDLLWEAEQAAQSINDLAEGPDVKQFFERRLVRYRQEVADAAKNVANKDYSVVFVGTIAVGKSTVICRAAGLESQTEKAMPKAVLETGGGGITICEVHIRRGPGYGLIIEPCSDDEIRRHVTDFANLLLGQGQSNSNVDEEEASVFGLSREVDRALRNMTGLKRRRSEKRSDGSVIPASDDARNLAMQFNEIKALTIEILAKMELHRRDRRDVWFEEESGKTPLEWLADNFEQINNGRNAEFTIPKRIILNIPGHILNDERVSIALIDTQGIDDVAARADLERHFDDPHTIVLLCSVFNEAPTVPIRQLLTRAKEGGVRTIDSNVAILVLPRPGEALSMKEDGYLVQSIADGCAIKLDQIQLKLQPMGFSNLDIEFYNSAEDDPALIRGFLLKKIRIVREAHRNMLIEIIDGAEELLSNYEKEQAREIMEAVGRQLQTWVEHNGKLPNPSVSVHKSLLDATGVAHWRTIYASVARRGAWPNLNYGHQIGHGARRIATQVVGSKISDYKSIANNILNNEEYADAHDLVKQTVRVLNVVFDNIIRSAQLVGESVYVDELEIDIDFWRRCGHIAGRGYRDRINNENKLWFEERHPGEAEERVAQALAQSWNEALNSVRELILQR